MEDVVDGTEPERCRLLGGTFAILVQGGLAAAAVATLVYKRATERPRRPWVVWSMDASKQAFAGMLQHIVNLGFGVLFAVGGRASECAWYLTNFTLSVAFGVVQLWAIMIAYKRIVDRYQLTLLRSGEYGSPPSWRPWLLQMLVWGVICSLEKLVTAVAVIMPLHSHLDSLSEWLEQPVRAYPALELLLVMVCAPGLLNMVFFWAVDNLIMRRREPYREGAQDDKLPLLTEEAFAGIAVPQTRPASTPGGRSEQPAVARRGSVAT